MIATPPPLFCQVLGFQCPWISSWVAERQTKRPKPSLGLISACAVMQSWLLGYGRKLKIQFQEALQAAEHDS